MSDKKIDWLSPDSIEQLKAEAAEMDKAEDESIANLDKTQQRIDTLHDYVVLIETQLAELQADKIFANSDKKLLERVIEENKGLQEQLDAANRIAVEMHERANADRFHREQIERQNAELREAITEYVAVDGSNGKYNAMSLYDAKQKLDKALAEVKS